MSTRLYFILFHLRLLEAIFIIKENYVNESCLRALRLRESKSVVSKFKQQLVTVTACPVSLGLIYERGSTRRHTRRCDGIRCRERKNGVIFVSNHDLRKDVILMFTRRFGFCKE
ncbi:hypothetical protein CEXT_174911 [Caerostris extrusa]|uniref:Secreted protein n=1 Tax=Caerostris extrusa TaxID=172846 RepID=A0AAV4RUC4_CAEEX|nr:hypothetical protein CEXT_174911 [Caerostris extrusa]